MSAGEMTSGRMPDPSGAPGPREAASRVNVSDAERLACALGGGALLFWGVARRSWGGAALAVAGGELLLRGVTGHCPTYKALGVNTAAGHAERPTVKLYQSLTVNRPPEELYRFWRNFENLPSFMAHLESVTVLDDRRSHWVAKAPVRGTVAWDAEIVEEVENRLIAWRSLPGSQVANAGTVRFVPAPGGRGTEVKVSIEYSAPGGPMMAMFAKLTGEEPEQQVRDDLRRFKQKMEAGEVPTTAGQARGRR